ncbi:ATP-binding protein [Streptomyces sp. ISL-96]|uniref:ATP-binding protein n=1 Tax=Streptomyces sp. ISL-96 TaxID=2819191 RepID=UPI001BE53B8F|nr:ATP-binding protein [Streptomyces sp. ISL-96]MBT2488661.1 ATP-binding protein [Streptomyces sp. ISL-96]
MNAETAALVREFVQRLSATRRGARLARYLAVHQLDAWGIPYGSDLSDSVATVVGELAANAVTHGRVPGRDFELRIALGAQAIRIEVSDTRTESRPPAPGHATPPPADAEAGRGLLLVQALSLAWGVEQRQVGKTVWAAVPHTTTLPKPLLEG